MKRTLLLVVATTVTALALAPTAWGQVWPSAQESQKQAPPPTTTSKAKQDNQQTVTIQDFRFSPVDLTVQPGTTVTWVNEGDSVHTVTADDESFDSGRLQPGQTFSHTFESLGTVAYHCEIHRQMTASVSTASGRDVTIPANEATKQQPTTQPSIEKETPTKEVSSEGGWLTTVLIVAVVVLAAALGWVLLRRRAS